MSLSKINNQDSLSNIFEDFENVIEKLSYFKSEINIIQQQLKTIEKKVKKEVKSLKKAVNKKKNKGNKAPSGFAKPTKVSKELCKFLNKEEGTEIARTEVTSFLSSYVRTNNLQNKDNKKIILPDEKLKYLLGINDSEELTYFNLQKYMNKHFITNPNLVN
jgi:chromatin remodeling complex protein RSC6